MERIKNLPARVWSSLKYVSNGTGELLSSIWEVVKKFIQYTWRIITWLFDKLLASSVAAILLLTAGFLIIKAGFIALYVDEGATFESLSLWLGIDVELIRIFVEDLYANGGAELLSIAITVLVIESLNSRRSIRERKEELIFQMAGDEPLHTKEAARMLRHKGWLEDGSLQGAGLRSANLEGASLRNANLERANLESASLEGANLESASLEGANLESANLESANLESVNLEGAHLYKANLERAQLIEANLKSARLSEANLKSARLSEANLQGAILEGTNLQEANLQDAKLERVGLIYANLEGTMLQRANLYDADLFYANLQRADLRDAKLEKAYSTEANLEEAMLQRANLRNANLRNANLQRANLRDARLEGTTLNGANLESADLYRANLEGAELFCANLQRANLLEANLEGADLESAKLQGATLLEATLPDGTKWTEETNMACFTDVKHPEFESTREKIRAARERVIKKREEMVIVEDKSSLFSYGIIKAMEAELREKRLITTQKAAKIMGVTPNTFNRWTKRADLEPADTYHTSEGKSDLWSLQQVDKVIQYREEAKK
ncbi:MAG: pentapeptide repeat-containing protein [Chloroflexota bacterium]